MIKSAFTCESGTESDQSLGQAIGIPKSPCHGIGVAKQIFPTPWMAVGYGPCPRGPVTVGARAY